MIVRNCYIHDSMYGQNYKSRAHYNELWYNWIIDSMEGEVGPVDGRGATDQPNSHTLMVGNVIVSRPDRNGNAAKFVLMGSELGGSHQGTLYMFYNVLIAGTSRIVFIQLDDPLTHADIKYNIFMGSPKILEKRFEESSVTGMYNWLPNDARIPKGFSESIQGQEPGFVNIGQRNFSLNPDSPFLNLPFQDVEYTDGDGIKQTLAVDLQTLQDMYSGKRISSAIPDFGQH